MVPSSMSNAKSDHHGQGFYDRSMERWNTVATRRQFIHRLHFQPHRRRSFFYGIFGETTLQWRPAANFLRKGTSWAPRLSNSSYGCIWVLRGADWIYPGQIDGGYTLWCHGQYDLQACLCGGQESLYKDAGKLIEYLTKNAMNVT